MFDIRFHLGAGKYYKHWQIKPCDGSGSIYRSPSMSTIIMYDCTLKNERGKAERVFASQKRNVCGYVRCREYTIMYHDSFNVEGCEELLYDPKIAPYWRSSNDTDNRDGLSFPTLVTVGRRVFVSPQKRFSQEVVLTMPITVL
jgi:hypothetical protein